MNGYESIYQGRASEKQTFRMGKTDGYFPTISILCSVYFSFGNAAYYQMNQYNWWYMCFLPIQVIAGSIFICRREKRLKYRAVQMLPVSAGKIWIAKVVSCIGQIIVSTGMIAAAVAESVWF